MSRAKGQGVNQSKEEVLTGGGVLGPRGEEVVNVGGGPMCRRDPRVLRKGSPVEGGPVWRVRPETGEKRVFRGWGWGAPWHRHSKTLRSGVRRESA